MKKIKRTTIKIRKRELVILKSSGQSREETIQICQVCRFPIANQLSLPAGDQAAAELLAKGDERNLTEQI